ncbi:hypothetical protein BJ166DRAFT_511029 [Pestalotiopsis sp. NC0098]|nr:hypothetical protein BJ166DRAFT_511029 [Pestalotiopsis sp. NC0098]
MPTLELPKDSISSGRKRATTYILTTEHCPSLTMAHNMDHSKMNTMQPHSWDPKELLRQTIAYFQSTPKDNEVRKEAELAAASVYQEHVEKKDHDQISCSMFMKKMFVVLDFLYFQHTLINHEVQVKVCRQATSVANGDFTGLYRDKKIYVFRFSSKDQAPLGPEVMVSTLIHEMCHAYFHLLTDPVKYQDQVSTNGGHGLSWNALYHTISNDFTQLEGLEPVGQLVDETGCNEEIVLNDRFSYQLDDDPVFEPTEEEENGVQTGDEGKNTFLKLL